jgi:hypothetical protein
MPRKREERMNSVRAYESVQKILEGHKRGHCDLQCAVGLLEALWRQASEDGRKDIENALWTTLSSQPLKAGKQVGNYISDVLRVVIRAIATFGPTANLPSLVFGRLSWQDAELASVWAQGMCGELSYSMFHHADRFAQPTLDMTKALCATYTFAQTAQLTGTQFPQIIIDAAADLERIIEQIEFSRFAAALREKEEPQPQVNELRALLTNAGLPSRIEAAMDEADTYLQGTGQFDPKHAADLIRTCMDETHRAVVSELGRITGQPYEGPDSDGHRRAYMRQKDFIDEDEEKFFSCIYTLILREGTHRLLAPRETVLVMERTVRDYLLLLLRRLVARRPLPLRNA